MSNKQKQNRVAPMRFVNLRQTINRAKYSSTITEGQRRAITNFLESAKENPSDNSGQNDKTKNVNQHEL